MEGIWYWIQYQIGCWYGAGKCDGYGVIYYTMLDTVQTENWTLIKEVTGKNVWLPPPLGVSTRVKESYLLIFTLDFEL